MPPSVLNVGTAFPAAKSFEYIWNASVGDVVGATPVDNANVFVAFVPNVVCPIPVLLLSSMTTVEFWSSFPVVKSNLATALSVAEAGPAAKLE